MSISNDTFIYQILALNNWTSTVQSQLRYPEITESEIRKQNPEYIFLSSEPFPFKETHQHEIQSKFPNSKVILVDGEMFSWYGSRLLKAPDYFNSLQQIINLQ